MRHVRGVLLIIGGTLLVALCVGSLAAAFVTGEWRLLSITVAAGLILYGST
jgi:hypothetical protein